jgi:glutamate synthase (NADPH/NADH) small chain
VSCRNQFSRIYKHIAANDPAGAIKVLKEKNNLPAVCGRVCPQENQCEKHCILGIKQEPVAIGNLERYAADKAAKATQTSQKEAVLNGKKVAVIGPDRPDLHVQAIWQKWVMT